MLFTDQLLRSEVRMARPGQPLFFGLAYVAFMLTSSAVAADECTGKTTCSDCIGTSNAKCVWCDGSSKCVASTFLGLTGMGSLCSGGLSDARWAFCAVNMLALIISMAVLALLLLIAITVCCIVCCRRAKARRLAQFKCEDEQHERREAERKEQYAERRAERQSKLDVIRQKYGLSKGSGEAPYSRFDS